MFSSWRLHTVPGYCFNVLMQINSIRDVNCSSYSSKTKTDYDNKSAQPIGKRLLLMDVTDGVTEIQAMEYSQIPQLNSKIETGAKVKIIVIFTPLLCGVYRQSLLLYSNLTYFHESRAYCTMLFLQLVDQRCSSSLL